MSPSSPQPEPWLRGSLTGVHPLIAPVFYSFAQVREDLEKHLAGLSTPQVWQTLPGGSLGFHLKHMAGSIDRLTTYLLGHQLTEAQLTYLREESSGSESADELRTLIQEQLERSENQLRTVDTRTLYEERTVGRKRLPTTVLGLLVHLAEHTQRHLGQSITLAHRLRQTG